jgi:hypothetical protein
MLAASRLAQYVSRKRCERYLHLYLFPSVTKRLQDRWGVKVEPLSPLLSAEGQSFERDKVEELRASGEQVIDLTNKDRREFFDELRRQPEGRVYYYQPSLEGHIGSWLAGGRADLIEATRDADGSFRLVVIDIKASTRETVGFRLQVAFYAVLLDSGTEENNLPVSEIGGAIAARDSEFVAGKWNEFDLTLSKDEIGRLVAVQDSDVARAAGATFEGAQYHLGHHCDGCPYNSICFVDSAEREDLSLVPHLTATEKRALHEQGIRSVTELAELMTYVGHSVEVAPGREADAARITNHWALGSRLPILTQRARAALSRNDKTVEHRRALYGANWGSLPDASQYPDLIKVFIDAQNDHITGHIYLISALAVGNRGTEQVVEIVSAPPELEDEGALLIRWLQNLLPAVQRVADTEDAPVHVYLYDRRGQSRLLNALARHFDELCSIPAFYDLLTSTPALTQSMISFLGDEVCERQNLGAICNNLYEVSRAMGFKWDDAGLKVSDRFRMRIFDNRRAYARVAETKRFQVPKSKSDEVANKEQALVWVESAARFGTEIPLEYVYAAWGELSDSPEMKPEARAHISGFLGTTLEQIKALAAVRLRALRHIEESFHYKNRQIEKVPLALGRLDEVEVDPATVPLRRSLEDFLRLEHYARLQELLLHFALPPELRAQTGRTAILRCDAYDQDARLAAFTITDVDGIPLSLEGANVARFREGDFMTLNPLIDEETGEVLSGKRLVHGRLSVVEDVTATQVRLRLLSMSFKNSKFRFGHRLFEPAQSLLYTLDEMADDLSADKLLAACNNAETNHLYQWLEDTELGQTPRRIRPVRLRTAARFADTAHGVQQPHGLTGAQRDVLSHHITDRVLVLQGPPGTGKSHTLGFATLARALSLLTPARPFRIAVCTKTHVASQIALTSIRARANELLKISTQGEAQEIVAPLAALKVYKICNDAEDCLPAGVISLLADGSNKEKAHAQWERLMREPLLVVGGTPGGLYNLIKRGASKGKAIDWTEKYFDLVLVDEASQMGIAEALLAAATLREDGQFIAIGDHRQMPPILAHTWDEDSRRELDHIRPHLSIFEYLKELGFPNAALDESFRIPAEVAEFLRRHVYEADGVNFHSQNRERLTATSPTDVLPEWIKAALATNHPLVLIEHSETGSQQANEFEANLICQLVDVAVTHFNLDAKEGLGVVVPHRAQKYLLHKRLPDYAAAIDTVERFQGGERDLIIVSTTVSDREYAAAESEFLLDPRRFTVAISRPKRKVIVIASRAVFDIVPTDLDAYERGSLWKHLRHDCSVNTLWEGPIANHRITVRAMKRKDISE